MDKALVLDYDGVIRHMDLEKTEQVTRRIGLSLDRFLRMVFGGEHTRDLITDKLTKEAWWEKVQKTHPQLRAVGADFIWEEVFAHPVIDREVLEVVRDAGGRFKTAILSNATSSSIEDFRRETSGSNFDHMFTSGRFGVAKPDPEVYEMILDGLGVDPRNCYFFDDRQANVDGARKVGIQAYLFDGASQIRSVLGL